MLRRCGTALLGGVHRATGARQATGTARDVVAAVSELRLPEKLAGREKVGSAAAAADLPLDRMPVQLAPYQALPVDGRITRHFTRGLPVVDPASRTPEVRAVWSVGTAAKPRSCRLRACRWSGHSCSNAPGGAPVAGTHGLGLWARWLAGTAAANSGGDVWQSGATPTCSRS